MFSLQKNFLDVLFGSSRIVLLKLGKSIHCKEAHVDGVCETDMVQVILLLEDDIVTQLLREPSHVCGISELVDVAGEEHRRQVVVFERHGRGFFCAVEFNVFFGAIVVESELACDDGLGIIDNRSVGLSRWR